MTSCNLSGRDHPRSEKVLGITVKNVLRAVFTSSRSSKTFTIERVVQYTKQVIVRRQLVSRISRDPVLASENSSMGSCAIRSRIKPYRLMTLSLFVTNAAHSLPNWRQQKEELMLQDLLVNSSFIVYPTLYKVGVVSSSY